MQKEKLFQGELLSRKEAARYLDVTEGALAVWLSTKRYNLPIVKTSRLAKYRKSNLNIFIYDSTFFHNNRNSLYISRNRCPMSL
jgi:hypothetical protein